MILQTPFGKTLPVSFIGSKPFIKYTNPIGGSDFLVMKIFANKFGFRPAFRPERRIPAMTIKVLKFISRYKMTRNSKFLPTGF